MMRRRSDRDRMLVKVDPWRRNLFPGSDPIEWEVPGGAELGSPAMAALLEQQVKYVRDHWLTPGFDLHLELVSTDHDLLSRSDRPIKIRFTAARRDTSSLRHARWLSDTPERTP